jgi:hypothetical protein
MDPALLLFFCCCVAFMSGYGVRSMISLRRRREVRKIREAQARLMRLKASGNQTNLVAGKRHQEQASGASSAC